MSYEHCPPVALTSTTDVQLRRGPLCQSFTRERARRRAEGRWAGRAPGPVSVRHPTPRGALALWLSLCRNCHGRDSPGSARRISCTPRRAARATPTVVHALEGNARQRRALLSEGSAYEETSPREPKNHRLPPPRGQPSLHVCANAQSPRKAKRGLQDPLHQRLSDLRNRSSTCQSNPQLLGSGPEAPRVVGVSHLERARFQAALWSALPQTLMHRCPSHPATHTTSHVSPHFPRTRHPRSELTGAGVSWHPAQRLVRSTHPIKTSCVNTHITHENEENRVMLHGHTEITQIIKKTKATND